MITMIIAKLSGRRRQSPIVQGEEGQNCLGTKDTLSIDTHRKACLHKLSQIYSRTPIT